MDQSFEGRRQIVMTFQPLNRMCIVFFGVADCTRWNQVLNTVKSALGKCYQMVHGNTFCRTTINAAITELFYALVELLYCVWNRAVFDPSSTRMTNARDNLFSVYRSRVASVIPSDNFPVESFPFPCTSVEVYTILFSVSPLCILTRLRLSVFAHPFKHAVVMPIVTTQRGCTDGFTDFGFLFVSQKPILMAFNTLTRALVADGCVQSVMGMRSFTEDSNYEHAVKS